MKPAVLKLVSASDENADPKITNKAVQKTELHSEAQTLERLLEANDNLGSGEEPGAGSGKENL